MFSAADIVVVAVALVLMLLLLLLAFYIVYVYLYNGGRIEAELVVVTKVFAVITLFIVVLVGMVATMVLPVLVGAAGGVAYGVGIQQGSVNGRMSKGRDLAGSNYVSFWSGPGSSRSVSSSGEVIMLLQNSDDRNLSQLTMSIMEEPMDPWVARKLNQKHDYITFGTSSLPHPYKYIKAEKGPEGDLGGIVITLETDRGNGTVRFDVDLYDRHEREDKEQESSFNVITLNELISILENQNPNYDLVLCNCWIYAYGAAQDLMEYAHRNHLRHGLQEELKRLKDSNHKMNERVPVTRAQLAIILFVLSALVFRSIRNDFLTVRNFGDDWRLRTHCLTLRSPWWILCTIFVVSQVLRVLVLDNRLKVLFLESGLQFYTRIIVISSFFLVLLADLVFLDLYLILLKGSKFVWIMFSNLIHYRWISQEDWVWVLRRPNWASKIIQTVQCADLHME